MRCSVHICEKGSHSAAENTAIQQRHIHPVLLPMKKYDFLKVNSVQSEKLNLSAGGLLFLPAQRFISVISLYHPTWKNL